MKAVVVVVVNTVIEANFDADFLCTNTLALARSAQASDEIGCLLGNKQKVSQRELGASSVKQQLRAQIAGTNSKNNQNSQP